jgi:hypothetical protein
MDNAAQVIAALRGLLQSRALERTPDEDQWKEAERALLAYDAEQALRLSDQIPQEPLAAVLNPDQRPSHRLSGRPVTWQLYHAPRKPAGGVSRGGVGDPAFRDFCEQRTRIWRHPTSRRAGIRGTQRGRGSLHPRWRQPVGGGQARVGAAGLDFPPPCSGRTLSCESSDVPLPGNRLGRPAPASGRLLH